MRAKGEERHKYMAYVLNKEFGYTMQGIAVLMKVSQPTISNWIGWAEMQIQINNLTAELQEARQEIARIGVQPQVVEIDYNFDAFNS